MNTRFLNILPLCLLSAASTLAVAQYQGKNPPLPQPPQGGQQMGGNYGSSQQSGQSSHSEAHSAKATSSGSTAAGHNSYQLGPVGRWWDDKSVAQSIGLSKEQQIHMDALFNANRTSILDSYKTFLAEQEKLNKLTRASNTDQASIFAAIDAVSKARTNLQKATAQMMLQIRQQLTASQLAKLDKMY